jgi:hypothetical protein
MRSFQANGSPMAAARLLLADSQSHFSTAAIRLPRATNAKEAEAALASCFQAISAWRSISKSSARATPEWLEAQLALADLYNFRGKLCTWNYDKLAGSRRQKAIFWTVRAGEAFESALACLKEAAPCGLPGDETRAIKHKMKNIHQEIHYSYYYASVLSAKENPCHLLVSLDDLGAMDGLAGAHAIKAIMHGHRSRVLSNELFESSLD